MSEKCGFLCFKDLYGCVTFLCGFSNIWYVCNVDSSLAIKKTVTIQPANKEQGVVFATTRFVYLYYFMFVSLTMSRTSYYCLLQTWRTVFLVYFCAWISFNCKKIFVYWFTDSFSRKKLAMTLTWLLLTWLL